MESRTPTPYCSRSTVLLHSSTAFPANNPQRTSTLVPEGPAYSVGNGRNDGSSEPNGSNRSLDPLGATEGAGTEPLGAGPMRFRVR